MKSLLRNITLLFFSLCLAYGSLSGMPAYTFAADSTSSDSSSTDLIIPPLDTLYKWAEVYSPVLKGQDALIQKTVDDQKRIKKILLDAVKLNTGVQYGNYGDPTINKLSTGYNSGVSIQFSLYQLASYKNMVNVYGDERNVAIYKKDELVMAMRKAIFLAYNNIMTQKNILKIRSEATYAAYSHMNMAEKEFNEGSVAISELSRVTEIYTKAQVEYEESLHDLKDNYMDLEQMVGRPLNP